MIMYTVIVKANPSSLDEVIPNVHADQVDELIRQLWIKYPRAFLIRGMLS